MRDNLQTQFVHSEMMFLVNVTHQCVCVCKQETEEYVVNDVMSVRVLLEASISVNKWTQGCS